MSHTPGPWYAVNDDEQQVIDITPCLPDEDGELEKTIATVWGNRPSLKATVVERDEREITGARAALNYGHTFAHAFEAAAGYGRLLHGEAVAIGMTCAARLAAEMGLLAADIPARQEALLVQLGLPVSLAGVGPLDSNALLTIMSRDKKSLDRRLRFVLPTRIGAVELVGEVEEALVRRVLAG